VSTRVAYLGRAGIGGVVRTIRLVGEHTDESWSAPLADSVDVGDALGQARAGAAWIAERIKAGDGSRLGALAVDVDGASCSWLTVPSDEASVVSAALEQSEASPLGEHSLVPAGVTIAGTSVQTLTAAAATAAIDTAVGHRRAVLCVPDAIVRIVIDELDARSTLPRSVLSLWHAIALAWDPGASTGASAAGNERIVATSEQTTCVVLIDDEGLLWSWARSGKLIACGRQRLETDGDAVFVAEQDVARLASDWLAWTVQSGQAPTRLVCAVAPLGRQGLSAGALGNRLGELWPGAAVDLGVIDDPLGETMRRLAAGHARIPAASSDESILALSRRSGRAHLWLHRSMAAALVMIGVALGVHAVLQMGTADLAREQIAQIDEALFETAQEAIPDIQRRAVTTQINAILTRLRDTQLPPELMPSQPVLEELERIALGLSVMGAEWDNLQMNIAPFPLVTVSTYFEPNDVEGMEALRQQLSAMPGTRLTPWQGTPRQNLMRGKRQYNLQANWLPQDGQ
jgi:hypothetical protein